MSGVTTAIFGHALHLLPTLVITVGCVLYVSRTKNLFGMMMLGGNLLSIVLGVVSTILTLVLLDGSLKGDEYGRYTMAVQFGYVVSGLLFGLGFLLMVMSQGKSEQ